MKILYVLSMALAFSMEIDSISVPYFLKYIIAFAGKMFMMFSFYVFSTYFLDNTLTLFANQFVYYVIPIAVLYNEYDH